MFTTTLAVNISQVAKNGRAFNSLNPRQTLDSSRSRNASMAGLDPTKIYNYSKMIRTVAEWLALLKPQKVLGWNIKLLGVVHVPSDTTA
eukprot:309351-Amphidinium_carterae.1